MKPENHFKVNLESMNYSNIIKFYESLKKEIEQNLKTLDKFRKKKIAEATIGDVLDIMGLLNYLSDLNGISETCERYLNDVNNQIINAVRDRTNPTGKPLN